MISRVAAFAFLVVCCAIGVKAQQCIPDPVYTIELDGDLLTWDNSTNCNTTHYIVNIHSSGVLEYVYQVDNNYLNVTFLSFCRTYTFTVTAIADHIIGQDTQYEATVALPTGTNITISNFTGAQIDRDVLLQWHVNTNYLYCAQTYKLLLWGEGDAVPEEILTNQNAYYITDVAQCSTYDLEISVEYLAQEHPIARFNYTVPPATNEPTLKDIRQDSLTINTTWALESYAVNRCNVTSLHVIGQRFNATIPIHDIPARPTVDVTIPGLRADSMYYFSVEIENEAGLSRPYQLAVQTLPIDPTFELEEDLDSFDRF